MLYNLQLARCRKTCHDRVLSGYRAVSARRTTYPASVNKRHRRENWLRIRNCRYEFYHRNVIVWQLTTIIRRQDAWPDDHFHHLVRVGMGPAVLWKNSCRCFRKLENPAINSLTVCIWQSKDGSESFVDIVLRREHDYGSECFEESDPKCTVLECTVHCNLVGAVLVAVPKSEKALLYTGAWLKRSSLLCQTRNYNTARHFHVSI